MSADKVATLWDRDTVGRSVIVRPAIDGDWSITTWDGQYSPRETRESAVAAANVIRKQEGLDRVLVSDKLTGSFYVDETQTEQGAK